MLLIFTYDRMMSRRLLAPIIKLKYNRLFASYRFAYILNLVGVLLAV